MDNRGSSLIENVISMFLLTLFAAMASSCIIAGVTAVKDASLENQRLYRVFSLIESREYSSASVGSVGGNLTFQFDGRDAEDRTTQETQTIGGTIYYENEKNILGEFIRD